MRLPTTGLVLMGRLGTAALPLVRGLGVATADADGCGVATTDGCEVGWAGPPTGEPDETAFPVGLVSTWAAPASMGGGGGIRLPLTGGSSRGLPLQP